MVTALTLDPSACRIIASALFEDICDATGELGEMLGRRDRDEQAQPVRKYCQRIGYASSLLEKIAWGHPSGSRSVRLDRSAVVAMRKTLRKEVRRARLSAKDSRAHGGTDEAVRSEDRLREIQSTLLMFEADPPGTPTSA